MDTKIDYNVYFKNYNLINDFSYEENDFVSDMLVKNYRTSIYNINVDNKEEVEYLKNIDNIMKIYILDSDFYKIIQDKIKDTTDNYIQDLNTILIKEYDKFQNDIVSSVTTSRWI